MKSSRLAGAVTVALLALLSVRGSAVASDAKQAAIQSRSRSSTGPSRLLDLKSKRAATNVCADGSGGVIDPHTLVSDAVASGLPAASETGVVFMRVSVGDSANCGPYECSISSDATGLPWTLMNILTNVPGANAGCIPQDYSLVAQIPDGTRCTGPDGACLLMCKSTQTELGTCAAVAYPGSSSSAAEGGEAEGAAATSSSSPSTAESSQPSGSTSSAPTVKETERITTTTTRSTTYTASQQAALSSSSTKSDTTTASSVKGIPTIVGFSGVYSPGGLAEQQYGGIVGLNQKDLDYQAASSSSKATSSALLWHLAALALTVWTAFSFC